MLTFCWYFVFYLQFGNLSLEFYLLSKSRKFIFFFLNVLINFHDFFVINCYTHDRLSWIRFLSFFLNLFIKIIYGHNLFVDFLRLLKIGKNLFILQFFVSIIRFEVIDPNHVMCCQFTVLFVFQFFENV